ncbi:uncharacterized protein QC763_512835 [Podospora pseudopauciseta]|uniref:Uncharacterized protein n=1 Tax=Podospora pseudopauciseta TaxID=2093780 RepID=A0ABR0H7W9_9PEZI|nr:hypothetical protein QC763_512835 [Podospora pseudopauciseta]
MHSLKFSEIMAPSLRAPQPPQPPQPPPPGGQQFLPQLPKRPETASSRGMKPLESVELTWPDDCVLMGPDAGFESFLQDDLLGGNYPWANVPASSSQVPILEEQPGGYGVPRRLFFRPQVTINVYSTSDSSISASASGSGSVAKATGERSGKGSGSGAASGVGAGVGSGTGVGEGMGAGLGSGTGLGAGVGT